MCPAAPTAARTGKPAIPTSAPTWPPMPLELEASTLSRKILVSCSRLTHRLLLPRFTPQTAGPPAQPPTPIAALYLRCAATRRPSTQPTSAWLPVAAVPMTWLTVSKLTASTVLGGLDGPPGSHNAPTSESPDTTAGFRQSRLPNWTVPAHHRLGRQRRNSATMGSNHRNPNRRPYHRPRWLGERGGGRLSWTVGPSSSRAAPMEQCEMGPGHRNPNRRPITGHGWAVSSVAVGELDGGPVIISGGADGTVRRWDLATGTPIGGPITGHDGSVNAVAVGELEGRPVIISGGADETVRRWDLASTELIGDPIEALCKTVNAVAAAELDGRPVIISGNADGTVRRWDLASGIPIGDPITGHGGEVNSVGVGRAWRSARHHLGRLGRNGTGVGSGHRNPHRCPHHGPHPGSECSGGGRARCPARHHLRQRRPDNTSMGPGHQCPQSAISSLVTLGR